MRAFVTLFLLWVWSVIPLHSATVAIDTFGPGSSFDNTQGWQIGPSGEFPQEHFFVGNQFISLAQGNLSEIDVAIGTFLGGNAELEIALMSDHLGLPDNVLVSFHLSRTIPFYGAVFAVNPLTNVPVNSGVPYWVVVGTTKDPAGADGPIVDWAFNPQASLTIPIAGSETGIGGPWGKVGERTAAAFRVTVAEVPEPATLATSFAGCVTFGFWVILRRRRSKRTANHT